MTSNPTIWLASAEMWVFEIAGLPWRPPPSRPGRSPPAGTIDARCTRCFCPPRSVVSNQLERGSNNYRALPFVRFVGHHGHHFSRVLDKGHCENGGHAPDTLRIPPPGKCGACRQRGAPGRRPYAKRMWACANRMCHFLPEMEHAFSSRNPESACCPHCQASRVDSDQITETTNLYVNN